MVAVAAGTRPMSILVCSIKGGCTGGVAGDSPGRAYMVGLRGFREASADICRAEGGFSVSDWQRASPHTGKGLVLFCVGSQSFASIRKIGRDMNTAWANLDPTFQIRDPEAGLAWLVKCSDEEMPEQERQFWQLQFACWQDWRDGDVQALGRALRDCWLFGVPTPYWLLEAHSSLYVQFMSEDDKRDWNNMIRHLRRWKAVKLVRGRHPNDPLNFKKKVRGDRVGTEAAKLVADMDPKVKAKADTVLKSYALIERAGGAQVTLSSYRREASEIISGARGAAAKKF